MYLTNVKDVLNGRLILPNLMSEKIYKNSYISVIFSIYLINVKDVLDGRSILPDLMSEKKI